jgi:hypothetical protein
MNDWNLDVADAGDMIVEATAHLNYNYDELPTEAQEPAMRAAVNIKAADRKATGALWEIGRQLNSIRGLIPHGQWLGWLETEFNYSARTAQKLMEVATKFPNPGRLLDLSQSALNALASADPESPVIDQVRTRIEAGAPPTAAEIRSAINATAAPAPAPTPSTTTIANVPPRPTTTQRLDDDDYAPQPSGRTVSPRRTPVHDDLPTDDEAYIDAPEETGTVQLYGDIRKLNAVEALTFTYGDLIGEAAANRLRTAIQDFITKLYAVIETA